MPDTHDKMSYAQACDYLKIKLPTIYGAISRGVLTPLPRKGVVRYLPAVQVKLFKGKPLALSSLTPEEGKIWEETARIAGAPPAHSTVIPYLTDPQAGEEIGERVGRNYVSGVYRSIREYDPSSEGDLRRPLAI